MAEKRLIDANALLALVADDLWAYEVEQFEHYVSKAPTVDAVEVVRCKYCKHWLKRNAYGVGMVDVCWLDDGIKQEDDFCSYGERRTDG